jgi:hypothetical protein
MEAQGWHGGKIHVDLNIALSDELIASGARPLAAVRVATLRIHRGRKHAHQQFARDEHRDLPVFIIAAAPETHGPASRRGKATARYMGLRGTRHLDEPLRFTAQAQGLSSQ